MNNDSRNMDKLMMFARCHNLPCTLSNNFIEFVQKKLDGEQWNAYINELDAIMFNEIDDHLPSLKYANIGVGKCILLMKSSASQKAQALVNALDFWFRMEN